MHFADGLGNEACVRDCRLADDAGIEFSGFYGFYDFRTRIAER